MAGAAEEPSRRRRRVRHQPPGPAAEPVGGGPGSAEAETTAIADGAASTRRGDDLAEPVETDAPGERGLRGLIGGGSSQVSPATAMRARDAARPRPEDIQRAEADLVIVRRRWAPRDPPPG